MEEGVKRKLPSWMSSVNTTANTVGQAEKGKGVQISNNLRDETVSQSLYISCKTTEKQLKKDPSSAHEILDNEPKKRKRKNLYQEADETLVRRKKGNTGARKIKNKREERSHERSEKTESLSPNEDDGELTVEDMLTIAQEYVRRDENSQKQQLSDEYCDGNTNSTIEETMPVPFIARSEDPAQDMLDLFLGPLLKHAVSDDKLIKNIEEDKTFVREAKEQLRDNSIVSADFVPLTKKKSSLKDKVAMFLD